MAWDYIKKNNGVSTYDVYPYTSKKGQCQSKPKVSAATVTNYVSIKNGDEQALTHAIATIGPITVSIDACEYFNNFFIFQTIKI